MIFTLPVHTRVEDFDQRGLLTPPALLSIFENTASRHADLVGYSVMKESLCCGMAWVVTNWRIQVLRAPSYEEPFSASTWLRNGPRQATREMLLKSERGEILARGQAKLCMVDRRTGSPLLPDPERMAAYQPELASAFPDRLPRLRPPASYNDTQTVLLRRSDMDYNDHLHNTAYLNLALDAAPLDILSQGVHTIRISYRSPLRRGDPLVLKSTRQNNGWIVAFVREEEVCALVALNEQLKPLS